MEPLVALAVQRGNGLAIIVILVGLCTTTFATSFAASDDVTYDSLSSSGRPQNFYRLSSIGSAPPSEQCRKLDAMLNEPYPRGSYDTKDVLLFNRFTAYWEEQRVFRSSSFYGKVFTFTSWGSSPISFLLHTYDAKDNPVDELYQVSLGDLDAVRLEDEQLDATRLKTLLLDYQKRGKWLVPRVEWEKDHASQGADYTNFASDYHWADVVMVGERTYALFASPPAFDSRLNLKGVFDIYVAPVDTRGMGTGDCRFTHP
jgi:hypothetical protein